MTIHFTPAELEALARTPRQQFADACAEQSIDETVATVARLAKSFRNFIDGFSAFGVGVAGRGIAHEGAAPRGAECVESGSQHSGVR